MASPPLRALVLGGLGFLGYHATRLFLERGHHVTVLSRSRGVAPPAPEHRLAVHVADVSSLGDDALANLLRGHDAAVFAVGADDRVIHEAPAYPYFKRENVDAAARFFTLARRAGVKRGVLLGSYFSYFAETWPELRLAATHPYVRSRVEQEAAAQAACGDDVALAVLRLPYVFGATPDRMPLWAPLLEYMRRTPIVVYPKGGSNVVAVVQVAEAIVGAAERGARGRFEVGDENLSWRELLTRLERAMGIHKPIATAPTTFVRVAGSALDVYHRLTGREGGLRAGPYVDVQTRLAFFDPEPARVALGIGNGALDEAFRATVESWATRSRSGKKSRFEMTGGHTNELSPE